MVQDWCYISRPTYGTNVEVSIGDYQRMMWSLIESVANDHVFSLPDLRVLATLTQKYSARLL